MQLSELLKTFETFWPRSDADDWDSPGLEVGSIHSNISKVLFAVDLTHSVIDEAIDNNCQLVVTHHPLLLRGVQSIAESELKGSLIARLVKSDIALFSAHTNADVQEDGASSEMARAFGLRNLEPLLSTAHGFGHGVIGELPQSLSLNDFAKVVSESLPSVARKIAFAGDPERIVRNIAICSGAGDSFIPQVLKSRADVFVTSDLRHHVSLDAIETPRESGSLALIDVSHWAAEQLWVQSAIEKSKSIQSIQVLASFISTDPWTREVK